MGLPQGETGRHYLSSIKVDQDTSQTHPSKFPGGHVVWIDGEDNCHLRFSLGLRII